MMDIIRRYPKIKIRWFVSVVRLRVDGTRFIISRVTCMSTDFAEWRAWAQTSLVHNEIWLLFKYNRIVACICSSDQETKGQRKPVWYLPNSLRFSTIWKCTRTWSSRMMPPWWTSRALLASSRRGIFHHLFVESREYHSCLHHRINQRFDWEHQYKS